jgi:DNA-binding transcriptional ArsR family regulator
VYEGHTNIMDMWLNESQLNVLLSIIVFFLSFLGVLSYMRFRSRQSVIQKEDKYAVLEAVLSKYVMRAENSTKMVGELRTKMDIIEAKVSVGGDVEGRRMKTMMDDTKSNANSFDMHEDRHKDMIADDSVTSHVKITRNRINDMVGDKSLNQNQTQNTVSSILKLLSRSPMTAREIQINTKKTREHTSRLMKRLYNESLVTRDIDNKPFLYKITDEGRRLLENHSDM